MIRKITVCITSCNRFDLLQRTLNSFFSTNTYPVESIIISEDSTKLEMKNKILSTYGDKVQLIFNPVNLGIYKSIDNIYNMVNTEYIFHCEDDWEFSGNINFMNESVDILNENLDIHQIWLRRDIPDDWIDNKCQSTSIGSKFRMVKEPLGWNGFSHNPGLRRLSDYKLMFPNGFSEFILPNKPAVYTEHNCMINSKKFGYKAASLENRVCIHIGGGRTTI